MLAATAAAQQTNTSIPPHWQAATTAARAAAAAEVLSFSATAAASARCRLDIEGGPDGIKSAMMDCSGGEEPVHASIDEQLLGKYKSRFTGVTWDTTCPSKGCLLAICKGSRVVFKQSRIAGVQTKGLTDMLCILGGSIVELQSAIIADNHGVGVCVRENATARFDACRVTGNVAAKHLGAGIGVYGNAVLVVEGGSVVAGNVAMNASGGGLGATDNATVIVRDGTTIANNTSINYGGGGVYIGGDAAVMVTGTSVVANNTARDGTGGGLACGDRGQMVVSGASRILHNMGSGGGGVGVFDNASVVLEGGTVVAGNVVMNATGGGLLANDGAHVVITGHTRITNNTAAGDVGGGLSCGKYASLTLSGGSVVAGNRAIYGAGGGLAAWGSAVVRVSGKSIIANNVAVNKSGGGVYADGAADVLITDECVIANNTATLKAGGGVGVFGSAVVVISGQSLLVNNSAEGAGAVVATDNSTLAIEGCRIDNNSPSGFDGGAVMGQGAAKVTLTNGVVFNNNAPGWLGFGRNIYVQEQVRLHVDGTVVDTQDGTLSKCALSVFKEYTVCSAGEYKEQSGCRCCPAYTYSFTGNTTACEQCPANAQCPGGDVLWPEPGFFHSGPQSVQIHQCPMGNTACAGPGGRCAPGYWGILCGECVAPEYGSTLPLRCGKCMPPAKQLGLYLVIACVTVVFVAITLHFTWLDNLQGGSQLRPSSMIKVLVQYFQYMFILGSISAPWPSAMKQLFSAASLVFGVANGQVLSLDCWLGYFVRTRSLPIAIQREIVSYLAPFLIFIAVVVLLLAGWAARRALWRMQQRRRRSTGPALLLWRKVPVLAIVTVFYAYPSLLKVSLGFFACLRVDDASQGPYAEFAVANHTQGYWVGSTNQECYSGWHKGWALGLGLPAVLLLCVAVPAALWWFLAANHGRCADPSFRERFGFLYRDYTDTKVWWEATWALQTVLLTCIAAFHFSLQAYYSVLVLTLMFLGIAVLQAVARPYVHVQLHRAGLACMACLFSTSFWTLAVFTLEDFTPVPAVQTVIAVTLLTMNCLFIIWCSYGIIACASSTPLVQRVTPAIRRVGARVVAMLSCCRRPAIVKPPVSSVSP